MDYPYLEHECTVHRGWPYTRFRGLQILYLQGICKGYLQAHNTLVYSEASTKSLQMADKMRKKLCVAVRAEFSRQQKARPLN